MTTISRDAAVVTLINVFTVARENQQKLVDMLVEATETTMKTLPGFVSANIHRSLDGTHVANYAQWRSQADFDAMQKNPVAREHMAPIMAIATFAAHLYEVVETTAAAAS